MVYSDFYFKAATRAPTRSRRGHSEQRRVTHMELADKLRLLRKQSDVRQTALAAYLNCSPGTVSNYENGAHSPDPEILSRLADFYHVSTDYLLGRSLCNGPTVSLDRHVFGPYTVADLLQLEERLPEKDLIYLIHTIDLLLKADSKDQDSK